MMAGTGDGRIDRFTVRVNTGSSISMFDLSMVPGMMSMSRKDLLEAFSTRPQLSLTVAS